MQGYPDYFRWVFFVLATSKADLVAACVLLPGEGICVWGGAYVRSPIEQVVSATVTGGYSHTATLLDVAMVSWTLWQKSWPCSWLWKYYRFASNGRQRPQFGPWVNDHATASLHTYFDDIFGSAGHRFVGSGQAGGALATDKDASGSSRRRLERLVKTNDFRRRSMTNRKLAANHLVGERPSKRRSLRGTGNNQAPCRSNRPLPACSPASGQADAVNRASASWRRAGRTGLWLSRRRPPENDVWISGRVRSHRLVCRFTAPYR